MLPQNENLYRWIARRRRQRCPTKQQEFNKSESIGLQSGALRRCRGKYTVSPCDWGNCVRGVVEALKWTDGVRRSQTTPCQGIYSVRGSEEARKRENVFAAVNSKGLLYLISFDQNLISAELFYSGQINCRPHVPYTQGGGVYVCMGSFNCTDLIYLPNGNPSCMSLTCSLAYTDVCVPSTRPPASHWQPHQAQ